MERNKEAKERIDFEAPEIIKDLFLHPYRYFSMEFYNRGFKEMLDLGCGNGVGMGVMEKFFPKVIGVDRQALGLGNQIQADVTDISMIITDGIDGTFCFETIEHLDKEGQEKLLSEIERVSRCGFVLGSVNKDGPSFVNGVEIYKGKKNPYHLLELNTKDFWELKERYSKKGYGMLMFGSLYDKEADNFGIYMNNFDLEEEAICNYLLVIKR